MTLRATFAVGGALGLLPPAVVLALLWKYGLFEIMVGGVDVRAVLWPSSVMLTTGWCCTIPGILITVSSVAINCLLYTAVALVLRTGSRWARSKISSSRGDVDA